MVGAVPADEALLDNGLISMQRLRRTIKHAATCEWRPRSGRRHDHDTVLVRNIYYCLYCNVVAPAVVLYYKAFIFYFYIMNVLGNK